MSSSRNAQRGSRNTKSTSKGGRSFGQGNSSYRALPNGQNTIQRFPRQRASGWIDDIYDYGRQAYDVYRTVNPRDIYDGINTAKTIYNTAKSGYEKGKKWLGDKLNPNVRELVKAEKKEEKKIEKEIRSSGAVYGVGKAPRKARAPTARRNKMGNTRATGCEVLASLKAPASTGWIAGDVMYSVELNPTLMNLPKLKSTCRYYERYRLGGKIRLTGASGTGAVGSYIVLFDADPNDRIVSDSAMNVSAAVNHKHQVPARLFDEPCLTIPSYEEPSILYLDNETGQERFQSAGSITLICTQAIAADTQVGLLYFDWDIELSIPQEEVDVPTGDFMYIAGVGEYGTSAMLSAPGTTSEFSSLSLGSTQSTTDYTNGILRMKAGNYRVNMCLVGCTNVTFTPALYSVVQSGKYAPYNYSACGFAAASATVVISDAWVGCINDFYIKMNVTAGTYTGYRLWLSGVSCSPYASSFRALKRLTMASDSAQKQSILLEKLQSDLSANSSSSTSSSSSSSSSSDKDSKERKEVSSSEDKDKWAMVNRSSSFSATSNNDAYFTTYSSSSSSSSSVAPTRPSTGLGVARH